VGEGITVGVKVGVGVAPGGGVGVRVKVGVRVLVGVGVGVGVGLEAGRSPKSSRIEVLLIPSALISLSQVVVHHQPEGG